jgi:type VI secretion system protein ImpL
MEIKMAKILKIVLVLLVLAALGGLVFWLVAIKGQPWWFAAALAAGLIGVLVGIFYVKKYLVRGRERKFIQRVIDQDKAAIQRVPVSQRHELLELQEHWKESVKRLQHSHLRKMGNPLYVLPWFLIMGESKAGKTSAVNKACQSTPMSEISRSSGLSGTRNCDWWFFDQAVILDTAGRYTIPIDEGPDLEEWKHFLVLLSKYRKKEPLNGVIVAIAADKLITADQALLREEGQSIRRRIDQMMRTMGAKFPVYVLITKMDLVHGFCEFNKSLPAEYVAQAMGHTNTALRFFWRDVLEDAVGSICKGLNNLRFLLAHQSAAPSPGAILFPTEFKRMVPGMAMFLEAVFEENPYQETPLLRGLYFSSALRKEIPASEFLNATGLKVDRPADPRPGDGLFLKDFFAGILPKDRDLFTPLREFVLWRRLTRSLGLLSWSLICLALCGFLGLSYYHNYTTIRGFRETFYDPPTLSKDYAVDLLMLDKMRLEILSMERKNRFWILPRFGLDHSIRMVDDLKKHYLRLFREDFLIPLDERLMKNIERASSISDDEFVDYAGYVVAQIGVLNAHLKGHQPPKGNEFRMLALNLLTDLDPKMIPEIVQKFGDGYFAYLNWNRDRDGTGAKLEEFRTALAELIRKRGQDLRWLVHGWVPETTAIQLQDFWGAAASQHDLDNVTVPGAFTQKGRQHIETFISYIESALGDRGKAQEAGPSSADGQEAATLFRLRKKEFWTWYRREFYRTWHDFIANFPKAVGKIRNETNREQLALLMTTEQNPYFNLLQQAGDEIKALGSGDDAPAFSGMILRINEVRDLAMMEKQKQASVAGKLSFQSVKLKEAIDRETDQQKARALEKNLELAHAWNDYMQTLEKTEIGISSTEQGYRIYRGGYSSSAPATGGPSSLVDADYAYRKLKTMVTGQTDFPAVWDLVLGPQDFLMMFAADQAACFLQDQWQEQVLSYLQGVDRDKIPGLLFDKQGGLVWKFINETAQPFISRNKSGYVPRRDLRGRALPFRSEFMHFLNQGDLAVIDYQPEYRVDFRTIPLGVNPGAKAGPYAAILELDCADKKYVLENYNDPQKATFNWSPSKCGDTSLNIAFTDFNLHKNYRGSLGFASFLKDFKDGSHSFPAHAFPDQKRYLEQIGVSSIKISYKISGEEPVVKLLDREPSNIPKKIIRCGYEQ